MQNSLCFLSTFHTCLGLILGFLFFPIGWLSIAVSSSYRLCIVSLATWWGKSPHCHASVVAILGPWLLCVNFKISHVLCQASLGLRQWPHCIRTSAEPTLMWSRLGTNTASLCICAVVLSCLSLRLGQMAPCGFCPTYVRLRPHIYRGFVFFFSIWMALNFFFFSVTDQEILLIIVCGSDGKLFW